MNTLKVFGWKQNGFLLTKVLKYVLIYLNIHIIFKKQNYLQ